MASSYVFFDQSTQFGRQLRDLLSSAEHSDHLFTQVRDVMLQMRDGDGTSAVHYAEVTTRFGFETDAKAKSAFEELDAAYAKTSGDGSVTNVRSARDQLFAKLRG
jgi:hypothetical protein